MALIQQRINVGTTANSLTGKPQQCHTCRQYKEGVFRRDANGKPQCYDCMPEKEKPVYAQS